MSGLKTIEEVGEIVGIEGLEYAIMDYLSASKIEDPELSRLWFEARQAVTRVDLFLKNKLGEDFFDNF